MLIKKVLFIVIIFVVCVSILFTNVFASDCNFKFNDNDVTITFNDNISCYRYIIITYSNVSGSYPTYYHRGNVFISNNPITFTHEPTENFPEDYSVRGTSLYYTSFNLSCNKSSKSFSFIKSYLETLDFNNFTEIGGLTGNSLNPSNIYISSENIFDKNGNLVFQVAPVTVEQLTIPEITQVEEIPQIMNKVLKLIIPIGLIVFFAGLLIYLVRLVILRMK